MNPYRESEFQTFRLWYWVKGPLGPLYGEFDVQAQDVESAKERGRWLIEQHGLEILKGVP